MSILDKALERLTKSMDGQKLDVKSANDQPDDEKKLVGYVRSKVEEIRNSGSRVAQEGNWMTNFAYLLGFDSVYWDSHTRQFRVLNRPAGVTNRNRIQINKILPTCQRRQARICQSAPKWEVRPDDASQEARDQARLEKELLSFYVDKERVLQKRQHMMMGLQATGSYYMCVRWNPRKGDLLEAPMDELEMPMDGLSDSIPNENTSAPNQGLLGDEMPEKPEIDTAPEMDSEYEGDIEVSLDSAFELFPDPLATDLDDAQYYIVAKVRKLDYFAQQYPEKGQLVKQEDAWLISIQNEMRINSMVGQGPAQTGIALQTKDAAIELVYYERKSKKYPKGRMVVTANGVLLQDEELPCGEFPHVKFDDVSITNKFYAEAIITHLRPIQDQFNTLVRKRAQWTNLMLTGKWKAAKGSQLQQEALNNQSGEILYYTPVPGAQSPEQMQVPVIPQYAYTEEDKLNGMFYDIAGEGEISRGILPSSSIPAIGMQLLLEQDQNRISTVTEQHEYAFARLGKLILMYLENFVTNERLLKIADPNAQYQIKDWSGENLTSKHDVIVVRGSTAPQSLATKRNDILNLFNQGLYGNPQDPQVRAKVLTDIEFGDVSRVWADQSADFAQISKSIHEIETGIIPQISEFDNHPLHIQEKNRYRKSDKYQSLDTSKQAILLNDMDEHLKWLMKLTAPNFGMTVDPSQQVEPQAAQMAQNMDNQASQQASGKLAQLRQTLSQPQGQ